MKARRHTLRVQIASQFAAVTLATGLAFMAVNFGVVEEDTTGLREALIGIAVVTVVAIAAGWGIAPYVLRPVRAVTARAQKISATNLHQRIGLQGPDDELQQLASTIDALLCRLEASFERERRFVANASHEIRTPLAVTRATLELGLNDTDGTVEELREVIAEALEATSRTETLAADLLLLARNESVAVERDDYLDLAELTRAVVDDLTYAADDTDVTITAHLSSAPMWGKAGLVDRLIANLVDNAIRHNAPSGWIDITTSSADDHALLIVRNHSSATIRDPIGELFEPFHRGPASPGRSPTGHGLGLSIVQAIALSHNARVSAGHDSAENTFEVKVAFAANR
ncbi:MAG: ATP-binding protein [Acidimicrobiales bacterium]